jgi:hypothetical protein
VVYLFAVLGWFALALTGIGIIVALEPIWNGASRRPTPACPRRRPARLVPSRSPALQASC